MHSKWIGVATACLATVSCSEDVNEDVLSEELHQAAALGREIGLARHLEDGDEYQVSISALIRHGERVFNAFWTPQEGGGRPLTKGTGEPLSDPSSPLVFPRRFNRLSAMDSNSCASCHNSPRPGGGGHFTTAAFLPAHRFDFLTIDPADPLRLRGARDELGRVVTLPSVADARSTIGMFGSGFIEMLARQMTAELQQQRDDLAPGQSVDLEAKGVQFGRLSRRPDGSWDTSSVEGLPAVSIASAAASEPPSLVIQPFHQSGNVVSLRQFTNNAFNHHHGMQSAERFGAGTDPDGDGVTDELSRADITATTLFQATLPVPGRVIPDDPVIEAAVLKGEQRFESIRCTSCHVASLPLDDNGWKFVEPNPYNPAGNLRPGDAPEVRVDLTRSNLPRPRLSVDHGVVNVPAYTDLKLHDITSGPDDPSRAPIDLGAAPGSPEFFAGNSRFLTKKLWGVANEPPYFHHGQFTTLREAILAHAGEAQAQADAFRALSTYDQNAIIEFLKTLQVLPPGTSHRIVDEDGHAKQWPPH
ncbi:MAG: di-heme oxidoredictase family protein [Kofleriaceae bacterium]